MGWTPPPDGTSVPATKNGPRRPETEGGVQMHTTQAGVDIAEAVFEVALSDKPGTVRGASSAEPRALPALLLDA